MPDPWRDAVRAWIFANPWTKAVSGVLAVAVWLYVQGDEVHEERLRAAVQVQLPPDLVTLEPFPRTVQLTVRGTRSATRRARESQVRLVLDVSDRGVGDHGLQLGAFAPEGLPASVQLVRVEPASLSFSLDEEAVRKVDVRPVLVGDPEPGFAVRQTTVEPSVIDLRGPRTTVSGLREVGTVPIDVTGLSADALLEVALDVPRGVQLAGDVVPTARLEVVSRTEALEVDRVPVFVWGGLPYVADTSTVAVTFQGPSDRLQRLQDDEVVAFVHLPEPPGRRRYDAAFGPEQGLRVRILHPLGDEVRVASVEPSRIRVERR